MASVHKVLWGLDNFAMSYYLNRIQAWIGSIHNPMSKRMHGLLKYMLWHSNIFESLILKFLEYTVGSQLMKWFLDMVSESEV